MLFDPTQTHARPQSPSFLGHVVDPNFLLLLYLLHREVLCCFGIRTEEIQLTAVKNFQVSKALVVAAEKIPLNVPNHRLRLEVCVCLAVD